MQSDHFFRAIGCKNKAMNKMNKKLMSLFDPGTQQNKFQNSALY